QGVLAEVSGLAIRGAQVVGTDQGFLDNVSLSTPGSIETGSAIISSFGVDDEGWTAIADVLSIGRSASGGNDGGYLRVVDAELGDIWYFSAPEKFLQDKSAYYGGSLSFDLFTTG